MCFESPLKKIYDILPPPSTELDEVLAILYTGPGQPTEKELARMPFLVRNEVVGAALRWLKLNHSDYANIVISDENLSTYPLDGPPVRVVYRPSLSNKTEEATSKFDNDEEDGVDEGDVPFVVYGLAGEQMKGMTLEEMKGQAIKHWNSSGAALMVGHSATPESLFNNPGIYAQLFPWLFPYGLGALGSSKL